MSIAECYVINVQCDGQAHGPAFIPRDQFTGNSKRAAMANLRDCGWKLGPNHTAYCRECKVPAAGVGACPGCNCGSTVPSPEWHHLTCPYRNAGVGGPDHQTKRD